MIKNMVEGEIQKLINKLTKWAGLDQSIKSSKDVLTKLKCDLDKLGYIEANRRHQLAYQQYLESQIRKKMIVNGIARQNDICRRFENLRIFLRTFYEKAGIGK